MAIESLVGLGLVTFVLLIVSIYAKHHRAEDHRDKKRQGDIDDTH